MRDLPRLQGLKLPLKDKIAVARLALDVLPKLLGVDPLSPEKGEGIFATRPFEVGDTVMVGIIEEVLSANHSHASQISETEHVLHAGLISKVNHSCGPNCGIRVNETGAHDFIAMK